MKYHAASGDITRFLRLKHVEGAGGVVGFEPQSDGDAPAFPLSREFRVAFVYRLCPLYILHAARP